MSPGTHPVNYTMDTRPFPGVKWPGRGVSHLPPSSAEVKERVELYPYSLSGSSWPVRGRTFPLPSTDMGITILKIRVVAELLMQYQGLLGDSGRGKRWPPPSAVCNGLCKWNFMCNSHWTMYLLPEYVHDQSDFYAAAERPRGRGLIRGRDKRFFSSPNV